MSASWKTLQARIDDALDEAVFANLFTDLMIRTPREVAIDLCLYCADVEGEEVTEVAACVADYQSWYRSQRGE